MVKELLVEVDDNAYEYLESTAKLLNVSIKDLLRIYLDCLSSLVEVVEREVGVLKERIGLDGYELASFIVSRVLTIPPGLYGMILVLDELIGAWSKGFTFTHGSGRIVDELGNVRGVLIHLDCTEVSMEENLVSCIELLIHDGGVTIEFHSAFSFEGFSEDEVSRIKDYVKSLVKGMNDRLSNHLLKCDEKGEVDVDVEEDDVNLSIKVTAYLKRFNCIPGLDLVNTELAKILEESGLAANVLKKLL